MLLRQGGRQVMCMMNAAGPRRRRAAFWKHVQSIDNPYVSARTSIDERKQFPRSANSFPKYVKTLGETSKIPFPGARMHTVPSVCVWHGTGETIEFTSGTLHNQ